ncbi:MAG: glycoside hydrolase family 43 protein [Gammaproteobacteria bacterium]|nr:MAG: glycoside hydrolase family 43 protein [Gammaproteobacteria bacterium]
MTLSSIPLFLGGLLFTLTSFATTQNIAFNHFSYEGKDDIFKAPLSQGEYQNPILAGFFPDPSIVRVDEDYYLVNSSFSYFPGVPIFHSKDLVHWESLGYILVSPKQLPLKNQQVSRGIYAPTLRYHKGVFYLITTLVDVRGNFIVTATDPAGPWSDPIELPEVNGIDPDIFFDDDGRVYITHNDAPIGEPLYSGHRAIWQWEFDLKAKKIIKDSGRLIVNGGADIKQKPVWIEGPHIYKINGWYYLLCAEGGTSLDHSQVVFRTRNLKDAFVPYDGNPILTQRDLNSDRANPIAATGHADLVQTKEGEWWAVFLGTRPYDKKYFNTGRETFLLPVSWKNEWPVILEKGKSIPYRATAPATAKRTTNNAPTTGNFVWHDNFDNPKLNSEWNILGNLEGDWYQLNPETKSLQLTPTANRLSGLSQPAFIGRRQQHMHFDAKAELQLPTSEHVSAGIAAFQNEAAHYYFGAELKDGKYLLFIEKTTKNSSEIITSLSFGKNAFDKNIVLGMEGNAGKIDFYYYSKIGKRVNVLKNADAKILSTEVAGGFVGTYLGVHTRIE